MTQRLKRGQPERGSHTARPVPCRSNFREGIDMPRPSIDVGKLLKLLMLTQSANDHEALSAIRSANAYLKSIGLDWNGLVAEFMASPAAGASRDPRRAQARAALFETLDDVENVTERIRRIVTRLGGR